MTFQMFHSNRIKYLILPFLCSILLLFGQEVNAFVKPTSDFYVNDYANILTEETKQYIMEKSVALNNVDKTQIVVVTTKDLEGDAIEDYANRLFREFGIGDKEKNNGVLILVSVNDRRLRIEVGYGLEGIINDGKAGRIRDEYMVPYLRDNDWDAGIKNGYDAIYSEIVKGNNLDLEYTEPIEEDNTTGEFLILSMFLGLFVGAIVRNMKGKNKFTTGYSLILIIASMIIGQYGTLVVFHLFTYFVTAYTRWARIRPYRGYRDYDDFGGFGGFGGGSSGGFGGFSGGGGSSGGGGASGSF